MINHFVHFALRCRNRNYGENGGLLMPARGVGRTVIIGAGRAFLPRRSGNEGFVFVDGNEEFGK